MNITNYDPAHQSAEARALIPMSGKTGLPVFLNRELQPLTVEGYDLLTSNDAYVVVVSSQGDGLVVHTCWRGVDLQHASADEPYLIFDSIVYRRGLVLEVVKSATEHDAIVEHVKLCTKHGVQMGMS